MTRHNKGASDEITTDVLKKKVMAAKGELPFSVINVNDHMRKFKFDNVHESRYDPRVINADCNRTYVLQVCMQGTQNNAIDDNIRHFDKQIDRDDLENLESTLPDDELFFLAINVKGYAVKFKFDNVYSCCPAARVSDTECDYMSDILNNMSNENIGHAGNEIDRRTRCNRDETRAIFGRRFFSSEFECAMFQFNCCVYPEEPNVIVTIPSRFLADNFSFQGLYVSVSSVLKVEGKRQWQTQGKPKTRRSKNPNASSSVQKL